MTRFFCERHKEPKFIGESEVEMLAHLTEYHPDEIGTTDIEIDFIDKYIKEESKTMKKIEMHLWMETEDDDEPMTEEQWRKEIRDIIKEVCKHINTKHSTYVKNADGEFSFESEGEWEFKWKKEGE